MANVNVFIEQNRNGIRTYFDTLAEPFPYIPPEESKWPKAPKEVRHHSLACIHKSLVTNIESVDATLQETSPDTAKGLKIFVQGVLGQIGDPMEMSKNTDSVTTTSSTGSSARLKKEDSTKY